MNNYEIKPNGIIKSGSASYFVSNDVIHYALIAKAGFLFVTKEVKFSGEYKIEPSLLLSSSFTLGSERKIGDLTFFVRSVMDSIATVDVKGKDGISGVAKIDLKKEFALVLSLSAKFKVSGLSINVLCEKI